MNPTEPTPKTKPGSSFVLYQSGIGSKVLAIGESYEDMWKNAEQSTGQKRVDMLKNNYVFDVVDAKEARRLSQKEAA